MKFINFSNNTYRVQHKYEYKEKEYKPKPKREFGYLYYKALNESPYKYGDNLEAIPISCFSNYLGECELEYQKLNITLWALGRKIEEYEDTHIPYSAYEVEHMINAVCYKENIDIVSIFTVLTFIQTLVKLEIIIENNKESFKFFLKHGKNWNRKESILKRYIETKIEAFLEDKKIIGDLANYLIAFKDSYRELKEGCKS